MPFLVMKSVKGGRILDWEEETRVLLLESPREATWSLCISILLSMKRNHDICSVYLTAELVERYWAEGLWKYCSYKNTKRWQMSNDILSALPFLAWTHPCLGSWAVAFETYSIKKFVPFLKDSAFENSDFDNVYASQSMSTFSCDSFILIGTF